MYNGQVLRKLIANAGLTNRQFQQLVFKGKSTDLYHVENAKSVTSTTLERMRDALRCSMDEFFTTPEWAKSDTATMVGSNNALSSVAIGGSSTEVQYLKELLQEKDKRIEVLENYVKLLEANQNKD